MTLCSQCGQDLKPVVAVDIDGTLGDYHSHFVSFAKQYLGRILPINYRGEGEFSENLGLEKHVYREIKLAYRQGGMKRSMPIFDGATLFIQLLREEGVEVWITTTRPYLRLDNIDPDTRHWLARHGIEYDGLLFNEDKYERLLEIVDPSRVVAVVDDQAPMIRSARDLGLFAIHRWTSWNYDVWQEPGSPDFSKILSLIVQAVDEWRVSAAV